MQVNRANENFKQKLVGKYSMGSDQIDKSSITLHIGLMKTASTFLQHNVFPKYPGVRYLDANHSLFNRTMVQCREPVLISNEDISGCPYLKEINGLDYPAQFERSLQNICVFFDQPKIVICFREPSELINSYYKQYLHEGGTHTWEQFFSLKEDGIVKKEEFLFSCFISVLKRYIPRENVYAYTFDDFKNNPESIAGKIYQFITGNLLPAETRFNTNKRSNPSIKDNLEGLLIQLNRMNKSCKSKWGFRLRLKLFGKTLNPRVLCQYLLPRLINFENRRDLSEIKAFYKEDWASVIYQIEEMNREKNTLEPNIL